MFALLTDVQITVEEARAKGIDIDQLEKKDAETDTVSPVGQAPPKDAVAALEEKTQELKVSDSSASAPSNKDVAAVPLPGGSEPKCELSLHQLSSIAH